MDTIKLKITTTQTVDEAGNEEVIELMTEAGLEQDGQCIIINYDESELTEIEGTKTRLKIFKDKLIVTKIGGISSRMEFEENKNYSNLYSTPYGTFDMEFNTSCYTYDLDEVGKGSVYVEYTIIFGGTEESKNKIKIDIL